MKVGNGTRTFHFRGGLRSIGVLLFFHSSKTEPPINNYLRVKW